MTVDETIAAIKAHPACSEFMALGGAYVVYYPPAYVIPGGYTVPRAGNDLGELTLLYSQIDAFWQTQRLKAPAQ